MTEVITEGQNTLTEVNISPTQDTWETWEWEENGEDPGTMEPYRECSKAPTLQQLQMQMENPDLMNNYLVRKKGYPNRYGARIPLNSNWDLDRLEELLQEYQDKEIVEWIRYGWPTGRLPTLPDPALTFKKSPVTG